MSYLDPIRLHFAGDFRANVSTVNNAVIHFNNEKFKPADRQPGPDNGFWQPEGTGAWRIDGCRITGGAGTDALDSSLTHDPAIGLRILDSGDQVSAKLVDLDPCQQLVSTIFGLELRIVDTSRSKVLMKGRFKPAAFYDIWWARAASAAGDSSASAWFQSVLTDVLWSDVGFSPLLSLLKAASEPGLLSVKFMTDRYAISGARKGFGRIVGTIGPQRPDEPSHFVLGRHLAPALPGSKIDRIVCRLDPGRKQVLADFGNAIRTDGPVLKDTGDLRLAVLAPDRPYDLGSLAGYAGPGWYEATAGIRSFPAQDPMSEAAWAAASSAPLAIVAPALGSPGQFTVLAREAADGIYARPDALVVRLEPGTSQDVPVIVTRFGSPQANAAIEVGVSGVGLQTDPDQEDIVLAVPAEALQAASRGLTDANGRTAVRVTGTDPGRPRDYIDGQVYAVQLKVKGAIASGTAFDPACFISVLLFSAAAVPDHVEWQRDVLPILQQYANLYPRPHGPDRYVPIEKRPPLHPVVDLADPAMVARFARRIHGALSLPFDHPNHMPVVRDLSDGRRRILLKWMEQILAGEPIPPPAPAAAAGLAPLPTAAPPAPGGIELASVGGKTEAMLRIRRG